ncbi:(2Fe-2S)-binding protein [Janibacter anophelis]|uniref:(2Fe-2S)-binding protein n=1 Tax=Janibacter anophelis TaxID=319054 RepID=UPI000830AF22|nr:(2Fe-2S)-binding protein [Janibacter anophelis]
MPLAQALQIAPGWIETYRELTIAQSGTAPPGMPSAFVLQYLIDPLATVVSAAARLTPFVLSTDPGLWSIGLDPTYLYPVAVQVRPGDHRRVEDDVERLDVAYEAYAATARAIATDLPSPTKMSSLQRLGMVEDMWEISLARLAGAPPPERQSCCLLYALPGCQPCAGCPRRD